MRRELVLVLVAVIAVIVAAVAAYYAGLSARQPVVLEKTIVSTIVSTTTRTVEQTFTTTSTVTKTYTKLVVLDALGRAVVVEKKPLRVVSLAPSITETICALGCCHLLVGVDQYSNYPPIVVEWVKEGRVSVIGGYWNPSPEKIIALKPDIVIGSASVPSHRRLEKTLAGLTRIVYVHGGGARTLDDILWDIRLIGRVLGCEANATRLASEIKEKIAEIAMKVRASRVNGTSILVVLGTPEWGVWVAGGGTYLANVMKNIGLVDAAERYYGWARLGKEDLLAIHPHVVLAAVMAKDRGEALKILHKWVDVLKGTGALRYCVAWGPADDVLARPGPRVWEAALLLAYVASPKSFKLPGELEGYVYCTGVAG